MAKYFDIKKALADGRTPQEIDQVMKANNLVPLPDQPAQPAPGMDVNKPAFSPQEQQPIAPEQPKQEGLLKRIVRGTVNMALGAPKIVGEAATQVYRRTTPEYKDLEKKIDAGTATVEEAQKFQKLNEAKFLENKELEQIGGDVGKGALLGAKKGAGTASFLVPGAGQGAGIGTAAGLGFAGGALAGFSQPTDELSLEESLVNAGVGGVTGAVTAGALHGAGKLAGKMNASKGITKAGEALETHSFIKKFGKPNVKEGGVPVLNEFKKSGLNMSGSVDDLGKSAQDILDLEGSKVHQAAYDLGNKGVDIQKNSLVSALKSKMESVKLPSAKKPYEEAIAQIEGGFAGKESMPLDEFYALKQEIGQLGKWNPNATNQEQTTAKVFEDVYKHSNDLMDEAFKKHGMDAFREINKKVSLATKALQFAERRNMQFVPANPLGLMDIAAGGAGAVATGNPLAAGVGVLANKVIQSPTAQGVAGRTLQGTGGLVGKIGEAASKLPAGVNVLPAVAGQAATLPEQPTTPPATTQPPAQTGMTTETAMSQTTPAPKTNQYIPVTGHTVEEHRAALSQAINAGDRGAISFIKQQMALEEANQKDFVSSGKGGKAIPAAEATKLSDYDAALSTMEEVSAVLSEQGGLFGPIRGRLGTANPSNIDAQTAQSVTNRASQVVGKALEGGVLRKEDETKYKKMLPNLEDPLEVAQNKLTKIVAMLQKNRQQKIDALIKAGYNPENALPETQNTMQFSDGTQAF